MGVQGRGEDFNMPDIGRSVADVAYGMELKSMKDSAAAAATGGLIIITQYLQRALRVKARDRDQNDLSRRRLLLLTETTWAGLRWAVARTKPGNQLRKPSSSPRRLYAVLLSHTQEDVVGLWCCAVYFNS